MICLQFGADAVRAGTSDANPVVIWNQNDRGLVPGFEIADAVPKGVTICNVFGHEPEIAEYVIMTMLVLIHRLFEAVTAFRAGS